MKKLTEDEKVRRMIENWDKVTCKYCGQKISMLNASMTSDGEYFVCKGGMCRGRRPFK